MILFPHAAIPADLLVAVQSARSREGIAAKVGAAVIAALLFTPPARTRACPRLSAAAGWSRDIRAGGEAEITLQGAHEGFGMDWDIAVRLPIAK